MMGVSRRHYKYRLAFPVFLILTVTCVVGSLGVKVVDTVVTRITSLNGSLRTRNVQSRNAIASVVRSTFLLEACTFLDDCLYRIIDRQEFHRVFCFHVRSSVSSLFC